MLTLTVELAKELIALGKEAFSLTNQNQRI